MEELIVNVNWVAVIAGAIGAYLMGMLWAFPKVLGTKFFLWPAPQILTYTTKVLPDYSDGSMKATKNTVVVQGIGTFFLAWVIGIIEAANISIIPITVLIAVAIATLIGANGLFAKKRFALIMVESVYIFIMIFIMVIAQATFYDF